MQLLSTLTGQSIERPVQVEMSCLGAAFLAGLAAGTCDCNFCGDSAEEELYHVCCILGSLNMTMKYEDEDVLTISV